MLGNRQQERLGELASTVLRDQERDSSDSPATIQVIIGHWVRFTRELGGGWGHPINVDVYDGNERLRGAWISTCRSEEIATKKAKEIARFLVQLGCQKDRVTIRKRSDR